MSEWRTYVREHLPRLTVGPERENEIVAELALQMEQAYQEALSAGATPEAAHAKARAPFRDWSALAHEINTAEQRTAPERSGRWTGIRHDLRYAARFLVRNPLFTALAVGTLAFGIGGNTAIFTIVDAVALRNLPYRDPDRIVAIETRKVQQPELEPWTSTLDFSDLRDRSRSWSSIAAVSPVWSMALSEREQTERIECLFVSASFFPLLGVSPALGRSFQAEEDNRARPSPVVILSHSLWQRRFAGSPDVLGRKITADNHAYTVIGVMPPGFRYAGEPVAGTASDIQAWFPLAGNQLTNSIRSLRFLKVIGRLAPGVSLEQSRGELRRIAAALAEQYPESNRGFVVEAQLLRNQVTGPYRAMTTLLLGTVGFVLLLACANVANLLLARASARQREISVRAALGASRYRLVRQLLTEGMVLSLAGGILGIALAFLGVRFLVAMGPEALLRTRPISLDLRALLFTAASVLACTLLAGLPPALRIARADIESSLRESGRTLSGGHHRLRSALVVVGVSVALLLVVGAGLLVRSFQRLLAVDPGFQPANLLTISMQVPPSAQTPELRTTLMRRITSELMTVPGVRSVAVVSRLPLLGANLSSWLHREGNIVPGAAGADVEYRVASPNYFATMGIPLRAGRWFEERDNANPGAVLLINETAARRFWPGESAVGKRVKLGANPERGPWIEVIGVVGDIRHVAMDADLRPEIYRPYGVNPLGSPILVIRTDQDPARLAPTLTAKVRGVEAGIPAYNIFPMQALVDRSNAGRRFVMLLLTGFALTALILASVGIYGTISQTVVQRTPEIGLRIALGATPSAALRLVFGHGLRLAALGIVAGAFAAAGLTRLMSKLLFGVRPLDPLAFLLAALTVGFFSLLACYIPARRATRVDPLIALRQE